MRKFLKSAFASLAVFAMVIGLAPSSTGAASHREAPLISMDPTADITDFFMFRSYEAGKDEKVVLIMDVIPGEEPARVLTITSLIPMCSIASMWITMVMGRPMMSALKSSSRMSSAG